MKPRIESFIRSENTRAKKTVQDAEITDWLSDIAEDDLKNEDMDEDTIIESIECHTDMYIDFIRENEPERILT